MLHAPGYSLKQTKKEINKTFGRGRFPLYSDFIVTNYGARFCVGKFEKSIAGGILFQHWSQYLLPTFRGNVLPSYSRLMGLRT